MLKFLCIAVFSGGFSEIKKLNPSQKDPFLAWHLSQKITLLITCRDRTLIHNVTKVVLVPYFRGSDPMAHASRHTACWIEQHNLCFSMSF
jgi:hypothetical protein